MSVVKFNPSLADALDLNSLRDGMLGITPVVGAFFAEAASICLEQQDHRSGIEMQVEGDCQHRVSVSWTESDNPGQAQRAWSDEQIATENGAYGIAALLIDRLTDYTVVERSRKGPGFDYWLGRKGVTTPLFQDKARLEVSGVRRGDDSMVASRVRQKINQMKPSDGTLPGVAVVVEFGSPRTRVNTK